MKKILLTFFAICGVALAQTTIDYHDTSLTTSQSIVAANNALKTGTLNEQDTSDAIVWILTRRPVDYLVSYMPTFANSILNDPTLHGIVSGSNCISAECNAAFQWKLEVSK